MAPDPTAEDRIHQLEARLAELEARSSQTSPSLSADLPTPPPPPSRSSQIAPPPPGRPATPVGTRINPRPNGGFEQWIGKHGLSLVGVILLVLGIGFFLAYTLQYLEPGAKDLVGLAAASLLFGLSRWFERTAPRFGQIVFAAAAASAYFTFYAMYFFPAAQIINSQLLEIFLLTLLSLTVSVYCYLHYQTEFSTLLSLVLLYLTLNIGDVSSFTFPALLVITLAVTALAWRKEWLTTLAVAMILSYLTYLSWGYGLHTPNGRPFAPSEQFTYDIFFLTVYYLLFLRPLFTFRQQTGLGVLMAVNSGFYLIGLGAALSAVYPVHGWGVLLFGFAALNAIWIAVSRALLATIIQSTAMLITVVSLLGAIPLYFAGPVIAWGWLTAGLGLLLTGYALNNRIFAWAGLVAFWLVGLRYLILDGSSSETFGTILIPQRLVLGLVLIVATLLLAQYREPRRIFLDRVNTIFTGSFNLIGVTTIAVLFQFQLDTNLVSLGWGLAAVAGVVGGIALKDRSLRLASFALLGVMILRILLVDLIGIDTIYRILTFIVVGIFLLGASWIYHRYMTEQTTA